MTRILPEMTPENTPFWTGGARGELMITHCDACDAAIHPAQMVCPKCLSGTTARPARGTGTVLARTINRQQWSPDMIVPYALAVVELDGEPGVRITARVVDIDPEDVRIDDRVQVSFQQEGDVWLPLFKPLAG
ncbi:MAG: OB-fold domain-containing protein [Sphingomonadaceae bacterium]|nr:OB-fold domain-containing protein [Sphingomonadaceae bacterium]